MRNCRLGLARTQPSVRHRRRHALVELSASVVPACVEVGARSRSVRCCRPVARRTCLAIGCTCGRAARPPQKDGASWTSRRRSRSSTRALATSSAGAAASASMRHPLLRSRSSRRLDSWHMEVCGRIKERVEGAARRVVSSSDGFSLKWTSIELVAFGQPLSEFQCLCLFLAPCFLYGRPLLLDH